MTQLTLTAEVYRDLLATTPSPIVVHDAQGRVIEANQAFADLLGYTLEEALALDAGAIIHPGDRAIRDADAERLLSGATSRLATERRLLTKYGNVVRARVRKAATTQQGQRLVMVILEDWTDDYAMTEELRQAVYTDDLTGVLNRRGFWRHLDETDAQDFPAVLALVGVDSLKAMNDGAGLAAGDVVLRTVASRLEGVIGPGAVAARMAGNEFLVLAPARSWTEETLREAIASRVAGTVPGAGARERITVSVTVGTTMLTSAEDFSGALTRAGAAMNSTR